MIAPGTLLRRLFGPRTPPDRARCRMSEAEALAVARTVLDGPLFVRDVSCVDDRVEWLIGTSTIGSGSIVRIDDSDGTVIETRRWGLR